MVTELKSCPACGVQRIYNDLHPNILKCWWCEWELGTNSVNLTEPFEILPFAVACFGCGRFTQSDMLDEGYCLTCTSDDPYEYDPNTRNDNQ